MHDVSQQPAEVVVAVAVAVAAAVAAAAAGSSRKQQEAAAGYGGWLLGVAIEYILPSSLSTPTLDCLCCTPGEYSPAGCAVRTGSRVAGEYSPARCTRDKPEAGEYSSASYLHHYLLSRLGSTPRPICCYYLFSRLGSTPRPPTCITTYSAGWGVLLG